MAQNRAPTEVISLRLLVQCVNFILIQGDAEQDTASGIAHSTHPTHCSRPDPPPLSSVQAELGPWANDYGSIYSTQGHIKHVPALNVLVTILIESFTYFFEDVYFLYILYMISVLHEDRSYL